MPHRKLNGRSGSFAALPHCPQGTGDADTPLLVETPASSYLGQLLGPLQPHEEDDDKDKDTFSKLVPTIDSARAMASKLFDASPSVSSGVKDQQLKSTATALAKLVPTIKRKFKSNCQSRVNMLENAQAVIKLLNCGKTLREEVLRKNAPTIEPLREALSGCVEAFRKLGLEQLFFPPD